MHKPQYAVQALILACALTFAGMVHAQQVPELIPPGGDPSRIQDIVPSPSVPDAVVPRIDVEPPAGQGPEEDVRFRLRRVELLGATVYSARQLQHLWQPLIGREVRQGDLRRLAEAVTEHYQDDGYIISRARVPDIPDDGVVTLEILEGYVSRVSFSGDAVPNRRLFHAYADRIRASRPLHSRDLQRYLYLMDDLPGTTTEAELDVDPTQEGARLHIVRRHAPVSGFIAANNRGSRFIGPWITSAGVQSNGVLGFNERLGLRVATTPQRTRGLRLAELHYGQALFREGTRLETSLTRYRAKPGDELEPFEIVGRGTQAQMTLVHPFVRSRENNLLAFFGFSYSNASAESEALDLLIFEDRIRALRLGAHAEFVDDHGGANELSLTLSQGVNWLNATRTGSPDLSRPDARSDFTAILGEASRLQNLPGRWSVFGAITGQYAFHPLVSGEEFGFGGGAYGRAFDASEFSGDSGAASKLELRFTDRWPGYTPLSYEPYGFVDGGVVWTRGDDPRETRTSATAGGLGVRFEIPDSLLVTLETAVPLNRDSNATGDRRPRTFLAVMLEF